MNTGRRKGQISGKRKEGTQKEVEKRQKEGRGKGGKMKGEKEKEREIKGEMVIEVVTCRPDPLCFLWEVPCAMCCS